MSISYGEARLNIDLENCIFNEKYSKAPKWHTYDSIFATKRSEAEKLRERHLL